MLRRQTRLRKEYLYRKALEDKDKQKYKKKEALRKALKEGKVIPTELRKDEAELRHEIELEDDNTKEVKDHVDDEYAFAGVKDPKVVVTTSRDPSSRLAVFAKEMKLILPNSQRLNRGNYILKDLVEVCKSNDITDLVIFNETRGEPDGMIVSHMPHGPTAYFSLSNVVMRHDVKEFTSTMSEAFPHLIFDNFSTPLGKRVADVLKYLYPVPKEDTKRMMTFSNNKDLVSFRHHTYSKTSHKQVELKEVGPRMDMKVYKITLGTIDQSEADTEWVARPYMNTAKKQSYL